MDRSFLSSEEVVAASRNFVCIRTATYEDTDEAEFIRRTIFNGAADLRNFGFCILASNAKDAIRVSNRGPNFVYSNSKALAKDLNQIFKKHGPSTKSRGKIAANKKGEESASPQIPQMKSFRLGLNVSSCDGLPFVSIVAKDQNELNELSEKLGKVIWDEELMGKFIFASTVDPNDLKVIEGAKSKTGILVIQSDEYGIKGELIEAIDSAATADDIKARLLASADKFKRHSKEHGLHVRNGRRTGTTWETEVAVPERRRGSSRNGRSNRGSTPNRNQRNNR